jgi:uncharacterized pyridoxal phosphate-containing UPF0001 family protein
MKINIGILKDIEKDGSQVLVVTKYFKKKEFEEIFGILKNKKGVFGFGENRILDIKEKNIDRKYMHFIGNIQSRDISDIVKHCCTIHSLANVKHAKLIDQEIKKQNKKPMNVFVQINISNEKQKRGIKKGELEEFLRKIKGLKNIKVLGISAMGTFKFTKKEKKEEFLELKKIRDKQISKGVISAGTSVDYKIALENRVEVLRLGRVLFD